MAHYRCYFLDEAGSIRSFKMLDCPLILRLRDRQVHAEQVAP
jgi:hypothetical protein